MWWIVATRSTCIFLFLDYLRNLLWYEFFSPIMIVYVNMTYLIFLVCGICWYKNEDNSMIIEEIQGKIGNKYSKVLLHIKIQVDVLYWFQKETSLLNSHSFIRIQRFNENIEELFFYLSLILISISENTEFYL